MQTIIFIVIAVALFGGMMFCGAGFYRKANASVRPRHPCVAPVVR